MTNKFIYAEDIAFENSGLADKKGLEESEHQFSVKEACDVLNKQHETIERQKRIIQKQEMILSDISIVLQDYYDKVRGK